MKVVVTGATGFVGRRLIRRIVHVYGANNVLCLIYNQADNLLENSGRAILAKLGVATHEVDITNGTGLDQVSLNPEVVFHLAADTDTSSPDHSVNDVGTANLLQAIKNLSENTHFIFSSTISCSDHRDCLSHPVNEETPLHLPFHKYGRAKLATEKLLKETSQATGMRLTILRFCAIYGQGTRVLGLFSNIVHMVRDKSLIARLNYPGLMSFTYVENIVEILVELARQPPAAGKWELYIPVGEVMTIAELIEKYYVAMGVPYKAIHLPQWFWKLCYYGARCVFSAEYLFPNKLYNKIWQLSLTVNNGYFNQSDKIQGKLPQIKFQAFRDVLPEMLLEYK